MTNLPGRKAIFQATVALNIPVGNFGTEALIPIPAGKRLVVEHISADVNVPAGQKAFLKIGPSTSALGFATITLVPKLAGTFGTVDVFGVSQEVKLFAISALEISVSRNANTLLGSSAVTVVGYLETQ